LWFSKRALKVNWNILRLQAMNTANAMASEFLIRILPRRGPQAFELFIRSLMRTEDQQFIAQQLDPELARKYQDENA
jgi:hypothetical protein